MPQFKTVIAATRKPHGIGQAFNTVVGSRSRSGRGRAWSGLHLCDRSLRHKVLVAKAFELGCAKYAIALPKKASADGRPVNWHLVAMPRPTIAARSIQRDRTLVQVPVWLDKKITAGDLDRLATVENVQRGALDAIDDALRARVVLEPKAHARNEAQVIHRLPFLRRIRG